jgi:hypothetical protein
MAATSVLLRLHVPPDGVAVNVATALAHNADGTVPLNDGTALTETVTTFVQPDAEV